MRILIIHGLMSSAESWKGVVKALCKRGHFVSVAEDSGIDDDRDIDDFEDYIAEVRTMLCYNTWDIVVAHGMGCIHPILNEDTMNKSRVILINPCFGYVMTKRAIKSAKRLYTFSKIKNLAFTNSMIRKRLKLLGPKRVVDKTAITNFRNLNVSALKKYINGMLKADIRKIPSNFKILLSWNDTIVDIDKVRDLYTGEIQFLDGYHLCCKNIDEICEVIQNEVKNIKSNNQKVL